MKFNNQIDTSKLAKIASGSYEGNDTENRAIPHTLGRIPKLVFINDPVNSVLNYLDGYEGLLLADIGFAITAFLVTLMDSANFYVGNSEEYFLSGNYNGATYYWVAFG